jgi:peptide/nickel transport system permease protein
MGKGIFNLIMVLGIVSWVQYARVVRTVTLSLKEKEFVEAARAAGTRQVAIVLKHILPNLISPVIVIAAVNVSNMILAEAALSFLGLGVQPPTPSWGSMLFQGKEYFFRAWWMAVFPGIVIATMVFGINLFGDGLRDFLNPRRRETK